MVNTVSTQKVISKYISVLFLSRETYSLQILMAAYKYLTQSSMLFVGLKPQLSPSIPHSRFYGYFKAYPEI